MSKRNFIVDMDLTILDSIPAFCKVYNYFYRNHQDFVPADPCKISSYDFKCICPLLKTYEYKMRIWNSHLFFAWVDFIGNDTLSVLKALNKKYNLMLCSIGSPENIAHKSVWIKDKLPFIKNYFLIHNGTCKMDKSSIKTFGGIILDDIPSNLESSDATTKILFGKIYPWNTGWTGEHCLNWKEVGDRFL